MSDQNELVPKEPEVRSRARNIFTYILLIIIGLLMIFVVEEAWDGGNANGRRGISGIISKLIFTTIGKDVTGIVLIFLGLLFPSIKLYKKRKAK